METQIKRMDLCTQQGKERVEQTERVVLTYTQITHTRTCVYDLEGRGQGRGSRGVGYMHSFS